MATPIGNNGHHQSHRPQANFQQALQRLQSQAPSQSQTQSQGTNFGQQGLAGSSQDAMLSFSPEAMGMMSPPGQSGANPQQLEQQIESGDLQGALSTIEALDASHPVQGNDPNAALKAQLKEKLEQGDQSGAEQTLEQIKANRPAGPPNQQQTR